jgi:hypothetical protein
MSDRLFQPRVIVYEPGFDPLSSPLQAFSKRSGLDLVDGCARCQGNCKGGVEICQSHNGAVVERLGQQISLSCIGVITAATAKCKLGEQALDGVKDNEGIVSVLAGTAPFDPTGRFRGHVRMDLEPSLWDTKECSVFFAKIKAVLKEGEGRMLEE